jgi:hypothetical protein
MTDPNSFALADGGRLGLTAVGAAITRTDAFGLTLWSVASADAADPFVALEIQDGVVVGTSWRGVEYRIALSEGTILTTTFVK